tara:strand:- start:292 stop:678 length:387 start_codon:yes stop_codon:yes gene_type:complete
MAHFAKLGVGNIVERVEVVSNDIATTEQSGVDFLKQHHNDYNAVWKQTSYNTQGGVHLLGGTPFRKNYAGIGYTYDEIRDTFITLKPYSSWTLNEDTCQWEAPVAYPDDGKRYNWNEEEQSWQDYPQE